MNIELSITEDAVARAGGLVGRRLTMMTSMRLVFAMAVLCGFIAFAEEDFGKVSVFGCAKEISSTPHGKEFIVGSALAGFKRNGLQLKALDARQLDFEFCATEPGAIVVDFKMDVDGKPRAVKADYPISVIPDGNYRPYAVPFDTMPEWSPKGVITEWTVNYYAMQGRGRIGMSNPLFRQESNLIPMAEKLTKGICNIDNLKPRAAYLLEWRGASASPEITIDCQDYMLQNISSSRTKMPSGTGKFMFTTPKNLVRVVMNIKGELNGGYPVLTLLDYKARFTEGKNWRGQWIWDRREEGPFYENVWFYKAIELDDAPEYAAIAIMADDISDTYVNDVYVGKTERHSRPDRFVVTNLLRKGKNEIKVRVFNGTQNAGLCVDFYASVNGRDILLETDETWKSKYTGKETTPVPEAKEFTGPSILYGDPAVTPPWNTSINFRYAGPMGRLEAVSIEPGRITAKVLKGASRKIDDLTLKRVFPDGKSERINILAQMMGDFEEENTITILYSVPPSFNSDSKLYLDDDFFSIVGNPLLAEVKASDEKNKGFQKAELVNLGIRPMLKFRGKLHYPAQIQTYDTGERLKPEAEAGYNNFFIRIDFPEFWIAEDKFDFSKLDLKVCDLLNVIPDSIFMLDIRYYMPTWWLNANPGHVSKTGTGAARLPYENEQAMGSKKWLQDSDKAVTALMDHIKSQAWCNRIWGVNVGESRNGEWFWGIYDKDMKTAMYGYSDSENETFRNMLREKYKSNEALQKAWGQPDVTFETATQPLLKEALKEGQGVILNPEKDMRIIDWYVFRNRVFAEAIIHFCKLIKQETDGKLLCGAYYGYLIELVENATRPQQHHGHNEFYQVSSSPYVDFLRAPARYHYKKVGMPGGFMQPFTTNSLNNVICLLENDERNSYGPHETWNLDLYTCRTYTNIETIGNLIREFAVSTVTGHSLYWKNTPRGALYEKPVLDVIRNLKNIYETLPPVQGLIKNDVAIVGDGESVYHTSSIVSGSALPVAYSGMFIHVNKLAVAYSVPVIQDMLRPDFLPPHKLYVMLPTIALTQEQRKQLMERFEREKASVLWLYSSGPVYPGKTGPNPAFNGDFLGLNCSMDERYYRDDIVFNDNGEQSRFTSDFRFGPHFYAESGYDNVLYKDGKGRAVLVSKRIGNANHYFSTLPELPLPVMDHIFTLAGVRRYTECREDPIWAGNDLIFVVARTGGEKRLLTPKGTHLKAIIGPLTGDYASNEPWEAIPGMTYGFLLEKGEIEPRPKKTTAAQSDAKPPKPPAFSKVLAFTGKEGAVPDGWSYNNGHKQDGKVSGLAKLENGSLHFSSDRQFAALFTREPIPAKNGQFFKAKATVSGKGRLSICFYQYSKTTGYLSEPVKDYVFLTKEAKEYSVKIPIMDTKKRDVDEIRVALDICPNTNVMISDLQVTIE